MPGTILVVDDEKNIVQLARLYLNNEGFRVEAAHDGKQALEKAKAVRPDLIVLDLMMPEMDGLTVCRELRKTSNVPVIILTARGDDIDRIIGLEIGADDYMAKPFNPRELVARVKAVLRRAQGERDAPEVIEAGGLRIDAASREATMDGRPLTLRAKEFDLLTAFAQHKGNVLDRERLLRLVWGTDYFGDSRTIDVHVAWLRDKLGDASVKIQTVWGVGYKLVVALAVFLAGAGALFLLRDKQQQTARERYGRLAEPLNDRVARLLGAGRSLDDVEVELRQRATDSDVRILLLDQDLQVVFDSTADGLSGKYVLSFQGSRVKAAEAGGISYKWADFDGENTHLTFFASPPRPEDATFPAPAYDAIIAIPQNKLSSAWLDLVPRLGLAGAIALSASFVVSFFISRSISGPLARITAASKQMAGGNYDVHIPIKGEDEVGRLAEAFNQMATEVNTSQRMMKDLLANVSHELKTPLTSIQGFSQAIVDGVVSSPDDVKEYSRTIHDESNRMRALVDDLMLLSQIESGQVSMQHTQVDIRQLLERTIERFQWTIRDAGIESRLRVEPIAEVHGDARRLEQVFSNLLQNAVRHTPRGGTITVSARTLTGGHVSIGVHNTGSVIPSEDLPRVFERFFQVDRARTRKGGSSGLGLSIVSEIVEAHGGTVRVLSSESGGTEFIVILPSDRMSDVRNGRVTTGEEAKPRRTPKKREAPA